MPDMIERISYLSQEIGPRPAGTEEEQKAANYIAESFEKEMGLPTQIQEFNSPAEGGMLRAVLAGVAVLAAILALLVAPLAIPLFLLTIVSAVLFVLEETGRPVISRFMARGVSQNVIAKYVPEEVAESGRRRRRKVIVVARYDSGKVCKELNAPFVGFMPLVHKVSAYAMFVVPVIVLLRLSLFSHAQGALAVLLNILTVLALVAVAIPVATFAMRKFSAYNEAANSNASGVAVMMEAASRMASGTATRPVVAEDDYAAPVVHGEEAAREQEVVPAGIELTYEAAVTEVAEVKEDSAVAPVAAPAAPADVASVVSAQVAAAVAAASVSVSAAPAAAAPAEDDSAPAWWKSAQAKARKSAETSQAHRSRFANVGSVPVDRLNEIMEEADQAAQEMTDQIEQLEQDENSIPYVPAPAEAVQAAEVEAQELLEQRGAEEQAEPMPAESSQIAEAPVVDQPVAGEEPAAVPRVQPLPGSVDPVEQMASFTASLDELEPEREPAVPSFLDPAVAQRVAEQKRSDRSEVRSSVDAGAEVDEALAADSVQDGPLTAADVAPAQQPESAQPARPRMVLPSFSSEFAAIKDRAGMLGTLPAVNVTPTAERAAAPRPSVKDLRMAVPSLSGEISKIKDQVASLTGPLKPVENVYAQPEQGTDELADLPVALEELELPETTQEHKPVQAPAVGSVYDDDFAEDQYDFESIPEPEPESRARGFLTGLKSRLRDFRRKNATAEPEYAQDLEPEQGFDPYDQPLAESEQANDREWKGGAFSLKEKLQGALPLDKLRKKAEAPTGEAKPETDVYASNEASEEPVQGEAAEQVLAESAIDQQEAIQAIRDFHNPYIETEVWFVALGAELADNAGMNAFMAEHASDLRGSVIVELDSLGAGQLSYVQAGGVLKTVKSSSRTKRSLRKAGKISGVDVRPAELSIIPSATTFATKRGLTAVHVAGMDGVKPALLGQADDVVENVNKEQLYESADFVMELVSSF